MIWLAGICLLAWLMIVSYAIWEDWH